MKLSFSRNLSKNAKDIIIEIINSELPLLENSKSNSIADKICAKFGLENAFILNFKEGSPIPCGIIGGIKEQKNVGIGCLPQNKKPE